MNGSGDVVRHIREKTLLYILVTAVSAVMAGGCGQSADDMYTKGRSLVMSEETFDEGIELLARFEKKHPDDRRVPEVILAMAAGYQNMGRYADASASYERLIERYPGTHEAYQGKFLLGYMYYDTVNDTAKARKVLSEFIESYPDSELTVSAKVLLENIGRPVDEWPIIRELSDSGIE